MRIDEDLYALAAKLGRAALARRVSVATAESCTGGLVAGAITAIAGSSDWFDRGFVTYSNEAKREMLDVDDAILRAHGAVSEPTAMAMAEGALARSDAMLSVAITGIALPPGGVGAGSTPRFVHKPSITPDSSANIANVGAASTGFLSRRWE